ncbi:MAG: TIM barrel protein, partial [Candidatus Promineifilaceae bacterium]|nr:TIM barrel protein [Candidatus Promineifilaceae bacterium]
LLDLPEAASQADLAFAEANDFMLPPPRYSRLRRPIIGALPGAPPDLWRYSRRSLAELNQRAAQQGVTILAWTLNSDFAVAQSDWPLQFLYLRLGVAAAKQLDARLLRVNLGGTADTPIGHDGRMVDRLAAFVNRVQRWCPGLQITVENHWGVSSDLDRHLRLFDAVAARLSAAQRAHFGCCFDPDNIPTGTKRRHWWAALAARANHYHFKTTSERDNDLPHDELLALLDRNGYQGAATIEYQGQREILAGVRQSVALFRRLTASD